MRTSILALVGWLAATSAAAQLKTPDVATPTDPVRETRYGVATVDDFRWMEQPDRAADVAALVRKWSEESVAQLRAKPQHAAFKAKLEAATRSGVRYVDVRAAGPLLVYRRSEPTDKIAKLVVREGGQERVLFDPAGGGANDAVGDWSLSPDGRIAAVHVSPSGAEVGEIRFLDTATGREVRERLTPVWSEIELTWLSPTRIGYTLMDPTSPDPSLNSKAYVADLAGGPGTPVLGAGVAVSPAMEATQFAVLDSAGTGDWLLAGAVNARADQRMFLARRADVAAGRPQWREIATLADQVSWGATRGGSVWLLSTKGAPNGQVLHFDAATGARTPVPTPDGLVLNNLIAASDGLYVFAQRDGAARLLFIPDNGVAREVALPFDADFATSAATADGRGVVFSLMGWNIAPRSYRVDGGRLTSLGLDSVTWTDATAFEVQREEAVSADGTRVPMVIVRPKGGAPAPTILEAYGSYGMPTTTPWYNSYLLAWTGSGGTVAYCGTRGGNERGRAWHEGGRERNKPNAHADFIACAERLVALGVARPGQVAATGTSAGGLLAPVVAQKRPDLFGALLPRVAILNPTRLEAAANGANQFSEMGDPRTEDGYKALLAQDAYVMLATSADLPDTLVTIGMRDKRVVPWMGAKFAAAAKARFGDRRLVLVRADTEAGHGGVGSTRDVQISEWADVFTFLDDRLKANAR
jgi:prolyl oligopeptidase